MNDVFIAKATELATVSGRDVYFYVGTIEPLSADSLIGAICSRENCTEEAYIILTTNGGDPDSAYRIIRTLQTKYKRIIMLVLGWCKSAGTLMALGINEIAMSDMGEFGPLDIQLIKDDEVSGNNRTSGNDLLQALASLHGQAMAMYKSSFDDLMNHSHGIMTTKTASEIAKNMVIGLLSPIFAQVEPVRMGAIARSNAIAIRYGQRLGADASLVNHLVNYYPSHGFVIDRREAQSLFTGKQVRELNDQENAFSHDLQEMLRYPTPTPQIGLLCCPTEGHNGHHEEPEQPDLDGDERRQGGERDGENPVQSVSRGGRRGKTIQ